MVMCAPSPLLSNRRFVEQSCHEVGGGTSIGCSSRERRGSGTSSLSSSYTVSRRSSMVSPHLISRRSSEVSQMGGAVGGGCNLISHEHSGGDPLSPETTRRGAPCPGGSLPGLPNLTPAQQYSLKAKYAAATGGPPPTPLPTMDQAGTLGRRAGAMSEYQGHPVPPFLQQGPRRHSANAEYGTGVIYSHQAPGNSSRRASDPIRSAEDPQAPPKRFNSLNNVSIMGRRNALQQRSSDSSLARLIYSPRPPSITENVMMEVMSVEPHLGLVGVRDRSVIIPPDERGIVGYQQQQQTLDGGIGGGNHLSDHLTPSHNSLDCPNQGFMQGNFHNQGGEVTTKSGQTTPIHLQGMSNTLLQQAEYSMSTCQLSPSGAHYRSTGQGSDAGDPWGNTHSQIQASSHASQNQQGTQYSDPSLRPQQTHAVFSNQNSLFNSHDGTYKLIIKPEQRFHPGMEVGDACQGAKTQQPEMLLQQAQCYPQQTGQVMLRNSNNPTCAFQEQNQNYFPSASSLGLDCACNPISSGQRSETPMMQVKEIMVRNYVQSQQALMWEQQQEQQQQSGIKPNPLSDDPEMSVQTAMPSPQQQSLNLYSSQPYLSYSNQNLVMSPPSHNRGPAAVTPKEQQLTSLQGSCYGQEIVLPRPPQGHKLLSRHNRLPQVGVYISSPPQISPIHSTSKPRRGVRLPPVQYSQHPSNEMFFPSNNNMYYCGQLNMDMEKHMDAQNKLFLNQQHSMRSNLDLTVDPKSAPLAPYPESAPINNALENLDLDNARIDFTSIIDDDSSTFTTINDPLQDPPLSSSQTSPRITTAQTSVSLGAGLGLSNMAVGDMTSLLTSLAGENKYLNTLS